MNLEIKEIVVKGKLRKQYFLNGKKITKKKYNILSQDYIADDINLSYNNYMIDPIMREYFHNILSSKTELEAVVFIENVFQNFSQEISHITFVEAFRQQADMLEDIAMQIECGEIDLEDIGEVDFNDSEED